MSILARIAEHLAEKSGARAAEHVGAEVLGVLARGEEKLAAKNVGRSLEHVANPNASVLEKLEANAVTQYTFAKPTSAIGEYSEYNLTSQVMDNGLSRKIHGYINGDTSSVLMHDMHDAAEWQVGDRSVLEEFARQSYDHGAKELEISTISETGGVVNTALEIFGSHNTKVFDTYGFVGYDGRKTGQFRFSLEDFGKEWEKNPLRAKRKELIDNFRPDQLDTTMTARDLLHHLDDKRLLGTGAFRSGYNLGDDEILKLPVDTASNSSGVFSGINVSIEQNKLEVDFYNSLPDKIKPHFAKPKRWADDYSWVTFEKADRFAGDILPTHVADEAPSEAAAIFRTKDIAEELGVTDLHNWNVGVRKDGSAMVTDYGIHGNFGSFKWSTGWSDIEDNGWGNLKPVNDANQSGKSVADAIRSKRFAHQTPAPKSLPAGTGRSAKRGSMEGYVSYKSAVIEGNSSGYSRASRSPKRALPSPSVGEFQSGGRAIVHNTDTSMKKNSPFKYPLL